MQLFAITKGGVNTDSKEIRWVTSNPAVIGFTEGLSDADVKAGATGFTPYINAGCAGKATVTVITQNNRKRSVTFTVTAPEGKAAVIDAAKAATGTVADPVTLGKDQTVVLTSSEAAGDKIYFRVLKKSEDGRKLTGKLAIKKSGRSVALTGSKAGMTGIAVTYTDGTGQTVKRNVYFRITESLQYVKLSKTAYRIRDKKNPSSPDGVLKVTTASGHVKKDLTYEWNVLNGQGKIKIVQDKKHPEKAAVYVDEAAKDSDTVIVKVSVKGRSGSCITGSDTAVCFVTVRK
jgi:hypothetical protein